MQGRFIIFMLLLLIVPISTAQDDTITWELISDDPISPYGERGEWNSTYNEPGAAIYYDEQYHLFINGYAGFPANTGIGYRISDDNNSYDWVNEDPLFSRDDVPNEPIAIATSDILVLEDGTWVLYYFNFNSANWPRIQATIGRATSDSPDGEWIADDEPVLVGGEDGSWDERSVAYASVNVTDDGFIMHYIGQDADGIERLGRATSEDGITWEKDSEPVFELDPELGEGTNFVVNQVEFDGERWILAYKSERAGIGFAFSEDGISWERYAENPVIAASDIDGVNNIGYMSFLLEDDGDGILYFEGNVGSRTQIYAATVDLP